jgi:ElaB/YqjD/DUF883 family membrane-anchored ribosome-binding protein
MENENDIAQILRDILEVLRDNNARIKTSVTEAKARADEARERQDERLEALRELVRKSGSNVRRAMIAGAILIAIISLFVGEVILRSLGQIN